MPNILTIQGPAERQRAIRYEVDCDLPMLGEGNFGAVRKGVMIDEVTGERRDVAIKFLYSDLSVQGIERSRREAAIRITSDSLVEMIDFVRIGTIDSEGNKLVRYHVVSELLQGVMLLDLLKDGTVTDREGNEIPRAKKLLELYQTDSVRFACEVIKEVLAGVKALHDNGYIHRDIDPSNIMITIDGKIKLIDLGIAKELSERVKQDATHLTSTGDFVGKPAYAAPELLLGDVNNQNASTDLYAIGILLYQLVMGKLPFTGTMQEITQQQLSNPVPVHFIPNADLRRIIKKATNKEQYNRYFSAAEMNRELWKVNADAPDTSSYEEDSYESDEYAPMKWAMSIIIGLALGVLFGFVANSLIA